MRISAVLLTLCFALTACDDGGKDEGEGDGTTNTGEGEGEGEGEGLVDADGDGATDAVDCDDNNPAVYPGADELCNGTDDNCDGVADENPVDGSTYYLDADGDGFGSAGYTTDACEVPSGFVDNSDDCDDLDATSFPGGTEVCDGADNDCNGTPDDDATDAEMLYADSDGDGYGDPESSTMACPGLTNYVDNDEDCDDTDASVTPESVWYFDLDGDGEAGSEIYVESCEAPDGGFESGSDCDDYDASINSSADEYCDEIDNNCDGVVDEDSAVDATTWYIDSDSDGWGDSSTSVTQCAELSGYVPMTATEDCDDGDIDVYPFADTEACDDGVDSNCDGKDNDGCLQSYTTADAHWTAQGESSYDYLGYSVAILDDWDGDGNAELAAGAYGNDDGGSSAGKAYVFAGPTSATGGTFAASSAYFSAAGVASSDYLGRTMSNQGDVNNDGYDDLVVGAYGDDTNGSTSGAVYVFYGPQTGDISASSASLQILGASANDYLGSYFRDRVGDLNGDGIDDIMVEGRYASPGGVTYGGSAYIFFGATSLASGDTTQANVAINGEDTYSYIGRAVSGLGDFDGDGYDDLGIGYSYAGSSSNGGGFVYYGPLTTGANLSIVADADVSFIGNTVSDYCGSQVSSAGDTNDDGYDDYFVGCYSHDAGASSGGAIFMIAGGPDWSGDYILDDERAFQLNGANSSDQLGYYGFPIDHGDFDGDGRDDLVTGSSYVDDNGTNSGSVYMTWGPLSGSVDADSTDIEVVGSASYDYFGYSLDVGDVDSDGQDDILVGAYGTDDLATSGGSSFLFYGADIGND